MFEPFYKNPRTLVINNPRRKKRKPKRKISARKPRRKVKAAHRPKRSITMARHRKKSRRSSRRRRNPVGLALANPRRRRSRRSYRRNPALLGGLQSSIKRLLPLPPLAQVASVAAGSWAAGFTAPRVLAMLPMFSRNVFGRVAVRLVVLSGLTMAGNMVFRGKSALAEMFSLGALANQVPHLTNDVLSLANVKINFGQSDEVEEIGYFYGEEPMMLGGAASPELGVASSPEMGMGYFYGQPEYIPAQ